MTAGTWLVVLIVFVLIFLVLPGQGAGCTDFMYKLSFLCFAIKHLDELIPGGRIISTVADVRSRCQRLALVMRALALFLLSCYRMLYENIALIS